MFRTLALLLFSCILTGTNAIAQNYFQQDVRYNIRVTLDDRQHILNAFEEITYINHSPNDLNEMYFHLWPNAYKDLNTALANDLHIQGNNIMNYASDDDFGFIDSLRFRLNGEDALWELLTDTIDICRIHLNRPLKSGDSLVITTPFRVKIPLDAFSRMGHNWQAYHITQWYPKPAVYDRNGWNYFSNLTKGEFYSEFGTYDVEITLPDNYVVGATGELINGANELAWLDQKAKETSQISDFPYDFKTPASSKTTKTLHYHQDRVHDFAWFADKRWHVLKGEISLPISGRTITAWAFFTNAEGELWKNSIKYLENGILYNSRWMGEYPYSSITAVDVNYAAGEGMEYPMVAAIGNYGSAFELDITIFHELAHNWFYGMLGSNERLHPWMDEGMTNFCETRYAYTEYASNPEYRKEMMIPGGLGKLIDEELVDHREKQYRYFLRAARTNRAQNPDQDARLITYESYGSQVYYKTTLAFDYLKSYLGDSLFDICMHRYFDDWKFKHPAPLDLEKSFEDASGKKLDWFFKDMIMSDKKTDYALCYVKHQNSQGELGIKNKGSVSAPILVTAWRDSVLVQSYPIEGFDGRQKINVEYNPDYTYRIDAAEKMPELYRQNNTIRAKGILRKTEPIKLQFASKPENSKYTQIFYMPVLGFNKYNSVMGGIALHNVTTTEKKFEYTLMPLFATKTTDLVGGGELRYNFYPKAGVFNKITWREGFKHYAYADDFYESLMLEKSYSATLRYSRLNSQLIFSMRYPDGNSYIKRQFILQHTFVNRDIPFYYFYSAKKNSYNYFTATFCRENLNPLDLAMQKISLTGNQDYFKITAELNKFFCYGDEAKGFSMRIFGGYADIHQHIQPAVDYRFSLDGLTGERDDQFQNVFLGKSEQSGFYSQQFYVADAGFKVPTLFYKTSDKWMAAINLSTTLPGMLPFRLFFDAGTFNDFKLNSTTENTFSYDYGVALPLFKEKITIFVPIGYSEDLKYIYDREELHFGNLIRFEIKFDILNPQEQIRTLFGS